MVTAREVAAMEWVGVPVPVTGVEEADRIIRDLLNVQPPCLLQFDRYGNGTGPHLTFRCPKDALPRLRTFLRKTLKVGKIGKHYTWAEHPGVIANAYIGSQLALQLLRYAGSVKDPFQMSDLIHFLVDAVGYSRAGEAALYHIAAGRFADERYVMARVAELAAPPPASRPKKRG